MRFIPIAAPVPAHQAADFLALTELAADKVSAVPAFLRADAVFGRKLGNLERVGDAFGAEDAQDLLVARRRLIEIRSAPLIARRIVGSRLARTLPGERPEAA